MSSDFAIRLEGIAKRYHIFAHPFDRLLYQLFGWRAQRCERFDALQR